MVVNINSNQSSDMIATVREQLNQFNQSLTIKDDNIPATQLIRQRSDYIDNLLSRLWQFFLGDHASQYALIAIGGYGRQELFPFSDIDLLILTEQTPDQTTDLEISAFLQCLWDIGLKPAQSIQTVAQSISLAQNDINFMTSILDTRFIYGNQQLPGLLTTQFGQIITCSAETFFNLKISEQRQRHEKFGDTGYRLEPNIKEGPGGLRDLQTIRWVAQSQYQINTLAKLIDIGLITEKEYLEYRDARRFLWKIRYTLHQLANKPEERLLFEYQTKIAEIFGYIDDDNSRAVEKFMQKYYCTIMEAERLNEMLLQVLATKFEPLKSESVIELTNNFRIVGRYLEITDPQVFKRYPPALIEIFVFMQQNQHLKGIHVSTLRLIQDSLVLIDDQFRANPDAIRTFMVLWRQGTGLTHELRRMKRYGVLAAYLPEFDYILGRMQFDLFHTLTVDEHILFVVRNLRRMSMGEYRHELPLCHDLFHSVRKPHILYLAGLFHDMGKGHGGNHSEIGAEITESFCKRHGLNQHDTDLLIWLVTNHLHMSMTAQRLDISDPDVINEFALHCKTLEKLNYLYLLTVADIRATNPELWNAWKDSLLKQLYDACRRAFRRGLNNPVTHQEIITDVRNESSHQLLELGIDKTKFQDIWKRLNDDYFIRHSAKECTWHTLALLVGETDDSPLVCIRPLPFKQAAEVFAHAKDNFPLFTGIAHTLDRLGLNVVDARMLPTNDKAIVCSFLVVENSAHDLEDLYRQQQIVNEIKQHLTDIKTTDLSISRRSPEKLQNFSTPTQVLIYDDVYQPLSVIELISTDRPGLLSKMGTALDELKLIIHNAKVATIGERVEDLFYVTDAEGNTIPLDTETVSGIQQHILGIVDCENE